MWGGEDTVILSEHWRENDVLILNCNKIKLSFKHGYYFLIIKSMNILFIAFAVIHISSNLLVYFMVAVGTSWTWKTIKIYYGTPLTFLYLK